MESRNCPKCGKFFVYISNRICDNCQKEEEESFRKLKDFIDENPNALIKEVTESTGISSKKILSYIREGRIIVTKGLSSELKCTHCGAQISTGKFCDKCVIKINNEVSDMFSQKEPTAKMHIKSNPKD